MLWVLWRREVTRAQIILHRLNPHELGILFPLEIFQYCHIVQSRLYGSRLAAYYFTFECFFGGTGLWDGLQTLRSCSECQDWSNLQEAWRGKRADKCSSACADSLSDNFTVCRNHQIRSIVWNWSSELPTIPLLLHTRAFWSVSWGMLFHLSI